MSVQIVSIIRIQYNTTEMITYSELVTGLNHYMLDNRLLVKMDSHLTHSALLRVENDKKELNVNPQQWEYIKKDQIMMSKQTERFFFPKESDQLFWIFYKFRYGESAYEMLDKSKFLVEKGEKMKCIETLRSNKKQLSTYKIKGLKDTVEDDLVNSKKIDIKTFFALCITHNMNVLFIHKQKYYEIVCDPDNTEPPIVLHQIDTPSLKYGFELDFTHEKVEKYRVTLYPAVSITCPLKCISSYKVCELRDICKHVNIENELFVNKTKPQLYQLIIDTL